jgi:uncharacterized membrane protein/ribosomal protein L40E
MSLESGRKLGLTASLINVIMPIITVITVVFWVLSIFSSITSITTGAQPIIPSFSLFSFGLITILFVVVGIVGFVGIILFIVAMHNLAEYYNEPGIFKNTLYGFILNIIGGIVAAAIEIVLLVASIGSIQSIVSTPQVSTPSAFNPLFTQIIVEFIAVLAVALVFGIVSAVLYMRAFSKLAEKSGVGTFRTVGLLYLIGTVVPIGGILVWVAWILAASGFNALKPKPYSPMPTAPTITTQIKFCRNCGMANNVNAAYCKNCGKKLP